jgi:hypothetical protein
LRQIALRRNAGAACARRTILSEREAPTWLEPKSQVTSHASRRRRRTQCRHIGSLFAAPARRPDLSRGPLSSASGRGPRRRRPGTCGRHRERERKSAATSARARYLMTSMPRR